MKKLWKLFSVIAVSLLIIACGGGGGGGGPGTTPPTTTYSVSGTTVAGATINASGQTSAGTVADANGNYSLSLTNGNHTVVPSLAGYSFTPTSMAVTVSSASVSGIDFSGILSNTIPYSISGTVSGGTQAGVVISLSPGGSSTITVASGNYVFTGITNGGYTVTPALAGHTFTPVNVSVTVNGADVTSVNFTTPVPTLAVGKLLYPCQMAICTKDLSTGVESVVYGAYNIYPDTIVPYRAQNSVAFIGSNIGGIVGMSLPTLASVGGISGSGFLAPNCTSWPADYPAVSFDISPLGDFAVISSNCTPLGSVARKDIFLVKMDGSLMWVRVTDDLTADSQPVIGGVDVATGYVTVLFVKNGTEIWKQVVDPALDLLIGPATVFASNVLGGTRAMSVNSAYTHLAFMKNVGGLPHITVMSLTGGAEINLVAGSSPYWALDGSNKILYTANSALWVINPDGTGIMSVPTPSNLQYGLGKVVFGPAGF